jgi:hypothetical protein
MALRVVDRAREELAAALDAGSDPLAARVILHVAPEEVRALNRGAHRAAAAPQAQPDRASLTIVLAPEAGMTLADDFERGRLGGGARRRPCRGAAAPSPRLLDDHHPTSPTARRPRTASSGGHRRCPPRPAPRRADPRSRA